MSRPHREPHLALLAAASLVSCVGSPDFAGSNDSVVTSTGKSSSNVSSTTTGGGSGGDGGASAEPDPVGDDTLVNPSFEAGLDGWRVRADAGGVFVESLDAYRGERHLASRTTEAYAVEVTQDLVLRPDARYTLRGWFKSSVVAGASYLFLRTTESETRVAVPGGLSSSLRLTLAGLKPASTEVTLGVHLEGPADSWVKVDALELLNGSPEWDDAFLLGGDLSFRRQLDDLGVEFVDRAGNPTEVLEVLSDSGFNLARFRLHNDPGSPDHYPSNQFPPGYQNLDDTLANAERCSEFGLELLVSFHYSDYWTNPGQQYKPYRWEELDVTELEAAVYEYTKGTLEAFRDQGTPPHLVSLGNETNAGILWPEGQIAAGGANFDGFARLFMAGARAVREVAPETLIAVHLSEPGSALYEWLGWAEQAALDYDVVGVSLYPFWSNLRVDEMRKVVERSIELTGKQVIVVETGFPWSLERPSGFPTMIASNDLEPQGLETFGVSPRGQELFLRSLFQQLHEIDGVIGVSYWDPIWLDTPALPSNVPDTALFDWDGAPLRALDAFHEKYR